LKVIIDLHPISRGEDIGGAESIVGDQFPAYVTLVGHIAARMSDLPADRVALELLNEPVFVCEGVFAGAPPKWPDMQARLHAAARKAAPDLTLILTGACWGQPEALVSLDPARIRLVPAAVESKPVDAPLVTTNQFLKARPIVRLGSLGESFVRQVLEFERHEV
jgi:hypothetical protein